MAHKASEAKTSTYNTYVGTDHQNLKSESRLNLHFGETNTAGARYPDPPSAYANLVSLFSYLRFVWIALSRKVLVREDLKLPPSHPE